MSRSTKKGPFIDDKLLMKVQKAVKANDKKPLKSVTHGEHELGDVPPDLDVGAADDQRLGPPDAVAVQGRRSMVGDFGEVTHRQHPVLRQPVHARPVAGDLHVRR